MDYLEFLRFLKENGWTSREDAASFLRVSKKQVQAVILTINDILKKLNCEITSKTGRGNGYLLMLSEGQTLENLSSKLDEHLNTTGGDRIGIILKRLLLDESYMKVEDVAEDLYVSDRLIRNDLKDVKEVLNTYGLEIETVPHYGIHIKEPNELAVRNCIIRELLSRPGWKERLINKETICKINELIRDIFIDYEYHFGDHVIDSMSAHLSLMLMRVKSGRIIEAVTELPDGEEIHQISESIASIIEREFGCCLPEEERQYILICLAAKTNYKSETDEIPEDVCNLVLNMLMFIDESYGTKLHLDFNLCLQLSIHFLPLFYRMRYGIETENPLIEEIKSKYIYAFELACEGARFLMQTHSFHLSDDEIGFIALYIRLSLMKRSSKESHSILLVCSSGRGSAQIMKANFMAAFKDFISNVEVCSAYEFPKMDLNGYDYIFTTVPLNAEGVSIPIFRTSVFLMEKDIHDIYERLNAHPSVLHFFSEELLFPQMGCGSKKDVIHEMIEKIKETRDIPDDFEDLVLKRESLSSTAFGNYVGFPHPISMRAKDTFVAVASLKKPISWGKGQKAQLIIMASIAYNTDENLQPLYNAVTHIVSNREIVQDLIGNLNMDTIAASIGRK